MEQFIENFKAQLMDPDAQVIEATTEFRKLDEWSSLTALITIGMFDEIYGVELTDKDIRNSKTISDLFEITKK